MTDIAEHALQALKESTIRTVHLVGRRGPAQAACTAKEVRELLGQSQVTGHKPSVTHCKSQFTSHRSQCPG